MNSARSRLDNAEANFQRQDQADRQGLGLLTAQAKLANAEAEYRRRRQFNRSGNNTLGSQAKLTNARGEYQRKLTLFQSGGISKSQLDKAQEELTSAQAFAQERGIDTKTQLDKAAEDLAAARANFREKQLETRSQLGKVKTELLTIRESVKERQAELEQTIQTLTAQIQQERARLAELREVRPTDVRIAQAQLEKAKIAVEQKQAALRDSEVRVPVAGQILKINTRIGEQVNISQGIVDPEDPDDICVLSYEWHKYEVTSIPENFEFRLIAEREPVCFQDASIAAMVALFWCDINHSNMLVPDYDKQPDFDFLDPYGTFQKCLFEQWEKPIQGRYKQIHWFVEAAIKAYESRIANDGVDAAISLRMSDIAATELKSDQQSNKKSREFETAGLETVTTADIGTINSTNPKEQEVSLCETATVAQPSDVLNKPADAPKQLATKSEQDAALKPIDKAKVERNDWLLEMRGKDQRPKMTEKELSNALSKKCEEEPNWVHIEPRSIPAALREAYKRQTGNLWPFDGRGRTKKA